MGKWYENNITDSEIVISSRVRLARNLRNYSFSLKLSDDGAEALLSKIKSVLLNSQDIFHTSFKYVEISKLEATEKRAMMEKHIISPELLQKNQKCGVIVSEEEKAAVLINEEDHLRIQAFFPGEALDKAWALADKIDDVIEEKSEYAFDENYGYLTSCPTNVGTGLRASYMMHLPILEKSRQLGNIVQAIGKFGIAVRGIYGEGTEPMGSIYQISNQMTLGQSEGEIMNNLKNVANQVIEQELRLRDKVLKEQGNALEDQFYRSYGILKYAHSISSKEAMEYLSNIREGYITGLLKLPKPKTGIYELMMNIQPGNIQSVFPQDITKEKRDQIRAKYLREQFLNENEINI